MRRSPEPGVRQSHRRQQGVREECRRSPGPAAPAEENLGVGRAGARDWSARSLTQSPPELATLSQTSCLFCLACVQACCGTCRHATL